MSIKRTVIGIGLGLFVLAGIIACGGDDNKVPDPTPTVASVVNDTPLEWDKCKGLVSIHYNASKRYQISATEYRRAISFTAKYGIFDGNYALGTHEKLGQKLREHESDMRDALKGSIFTFDRDVIPAGCVSYHEKVGSSITGENFDKCWSVYKSAAKSIQNKEYQNEISDVPYHSHRLLGQVALMNHSLLQDAADKESIQLCTPSEWEDASLEIYLLDTLDQIPTR